jgi:hypothetical protein
MHFLCSQLFGSTASIGGHCPNLRSVLIIFAAIGLDAQHGECCLAAIVGEREAAEGFYFKHIGHFNRLLTILREGKDVYENGDLEEEQFLHG